MWQGKSKCVKIGLMTDMTKTKVIKVENNNLQQKLIREIEREIIEERYLYVGKTRIDMKMQTVDLRTWKCHTRKSKKKFLTHMKIPLLQPIPVQYYKYKGVGNEIYI